MNASSRSRADVVALLIIAFMLAALLAPALAASNAQSDKNECMNRMKLLNIALINAQDTYGAYPLASSEPFDHPPGAAGKEPSGYSWLVRLLPFAEHQRLYNRLAERDRSNKLSIPPFEPVVREIDNRINRVIMAEPIPEFVCPSFIGGPSVADGAPEYAVFAADTRPAITSYHSTASSHFLNTEDIGKLATTEKIGNFAYVGNGVIVFPGKAGDRLTKKGIRMSYIVDGTSSTFVFAESNERNYAAWIDGQTTWLVSAWPSNPDVPTTTKDPTDTNNFGWQRLGWSDEQLENNQVTPTAQKGIDAKDEPPVYLPGGRWTGSVQRTWGASSNHPEGIGHAFADGHARMLSRDIDPVVYLHLTTRNGREPIDQDAIE